MTSSAEQTRARILHDMGLVAWTLRDKTQTVAAKAAAEIREPVAATESSLPTWDELQTAVSSCTRCALAEQRHHTVFGVGARAARRMIVGEAPGAEEDRRGEPFVGRAGQLLDAMLMALGTCREEVFITNIVKCRPPGNRDPKPEEAEACQGYLLAQIEHVRPALILALGGVAAHQLLGVDTPVGKLRGRVHEGPGACPLVVTYHPAYLLRTPTAKRHVWADLQLAQSHVTVRAS
ncbi:MAG: uracil-DNA glycosylase [Gammaproteobacteria bacterium]